MSPLDDGEIVHGARESQPCLVIAVDHLERNAQELRAFHQFGSVGGVADRGRRDGDHARGPGSLRHRQEVPQRLQHPFDGVGA